jgi:hypothetical protein
VSAAPYAFLGDDEDDDEDHHHRGDVNEVIVSTSASSPSFDATFAPSSSSLSSTSAATGTATGTTANLTRADTLVRAKRSRSGSGTSTHTHGGTIAVGGVVAATGGDMPVGLTRFRAVASGAARLRYVRLRVR